MAPTVAVTQSFGLCFSGKQLRGAIICEAERRYRNVLGRNMRFSSFLVSKISKLCSRSKHKFAEKLLLEIDKHDLTSIPDHSKLLNKVSVLMGYNSLDDLIENGGPEKESDINLKDAMDKVNLSLACKRFPSITLGSSPPVELYDETKCNSESRNVLANQSSFLLDSMGQKSGFDLDGLSEAWNSLYPSLQNVCSSTVKEEDYSVLPSSPQSMPSTTGGKSDILINVEEDSTSLGPTSQPNAPSVDEFWLDRSISCVPGLSKRLLFQLENGGFHTLRKLLLHFPRTYADLQNAQIEIDDGQYFIFVGNILSSRGVRAGCSFSFLEVVVGCEIGSSKSTTEQMVDEVVSEGKKTIYLHLKKFFRGTRFTHLPFLRNLEAKHKVGDFVCVSGKVRTMRSEDHYEMREYNIDVLKDEYDLSVRSKGRLYPIYPSKRGLNPDFLRDTIARALQVLPVNFDPIPKEITQEFGLLCLFDAYMGIHQPKHIDEADLARKRLIFDEFFYLQLGRLFQMLEGLGTEIEKDGLLEKHRKPKLNATYIEEWSSLTKKFLKALPYSLTSSQLSAISEIIWDLKRPVPMNRLLQGDVGCGKTVVAFLACMEVIGSGYQAAFMVPTELLAIQHYEHLLNLLEKMEDDKFKPSIALLTGSTPLKQSRMIRKDLQTGDVSLVIGTHSLIAENVEFSALRLAVVDEQQRFGVIQRGRFNSKVVCIFWPQITSNELYDVIQQFFYVILYLYEFKIGNG